MINIWNMINDESEIFFFSVYFDDQKISTADLKLGGIFRKF